MPNSVYLYATAFVLLFATGCEQSAPRNSANAAYVQRVTVATKDRTLAEFEDQVRIRRLESILNAAKPVSEHKCASCGVLTLHLSTGEFRRVDLVPGHDDQSFELRRDSGMSSVSREELFGVLGLSYPIQPDSRVSPAGNESPNSPASQTTKPTAP